MRFQIALTSEHVAGLACVTFSELQGQRARNIEEDRRIAVKPESADKYVGRPNNEI